MMVMLVMTAVAATLMLPTAVIATAAATTAATTCHVLDQVLNLLLCGLAVLNDSALEVQGLACQWVVGVDGDTVFLNLHHLGHELVVLIIHQGDHCTLEDIIVIKVAVHCKYLAAHLVYTFCHILTESLCWCQLEIEVATFLETLHLLLESVEGYAEPGDELKGTVVASLLFKLTLAILQAVQLVYNRHKSVFCFFHYTYLYILFSFSLQSYAFSIKYTKV